jgi:hypothetical protein
LKTQEQLAAELRRAAYIAAAGTVEPGRNLMTVLRRLSQVDYIFDEFAYFIINGKKKTHKHGNESNHKDRSKVACVPVAERVGDDARNCRCKNEAGCCACQTNAEPEKG